MRKGLGASLVPIRLSGRLMLSSNLARSASLPTSPSPAAVLIACSCVPAVRGLSPADRKVCSLTSFPIMDWEVMKGRLEVRARVEMRGVHAGRALLYSSPCWRSV